MRNDYAGFFIVLKKNSPICLPFFLTFGEFSFSLVREALNEAFSIYYTFFENKDTKNFVKLIENFMLDEKEEKDVLLVVLFTKEDLMEVSIEEMGFIIKEVFKREIFPKDTYMRRFIYYFQELKHFFNTYVSTCMKVKNLIEEGKIYFVLEPIVDINKDIYGFEFLARLVDKDDHIMIPTDYFTCLDKDKNLFEFFEEVVFSRMLSFIRNANNKLPRFWKLHFNFTSNFVVKNIRLFEKYFTREPYTELVRIELTEKGFFLKEYLEVVNYLLQRGVDFVIDDLGAGTCNLDVLFKTKIKHVKIEVDFYKENRDFLENLLKSLCKNGRIIFFEKVSNSEIFEELKADETFSKCYYQGFLFTKDRHLSSHISRLKSNFKDIILENSERGVGL